MKKNQSDNKKTKSAAIIFVAIALVFFTTGNFFAGTGDNKNECVHDLGSEEFYCDEDLCENEFDADCQILVANKNPYVKWVCTACGKKVQRPKSMGRPAPDRCRAKKNGGGHSWVRD